MQRHQEDEDTKQRDLNSQTTPTQKTETQTENSSFHFSLVSCEHNLVYNYYWLKMFMSQILIKKSMAEAHSVLWEANGEAVMR